MIKEKDANQTPRDKNNSIWNEKNTVGGISKRLNNVEEKTSELEDFAVGTI